MYTKNLQNSRYAGLFSRGFLEPGIDV